VVPVITSPYFLAGRRYRCSCCGGAFRRLLPGGDKGRPNARCPRCGSLERQRALALFLRQWLAELHPRDILHVAPEAGIRGMLETYPDARYIGADIAPEPGDAKVDITQIPYADASFDLVSCSHVLEHVSDDGLAMSEIRRVLRPTGVALLQQPISYELAETIEDPAVIDPAERERRFGQHDHVRMYARDIEDRLRSAGFRVRVVRPAEELDASTRERYRLDEPWGAGGSGSDVYYCRRSAAPD
jgi:SAM-dependent methyltransferase